jgi:diguanylate cyclase (GGDEF)-like protein
VRGGIATWLLLLCANFSPTASEAVEAPAHRSLDVRLLGVASPGAGPVNPAVDTLTSGALDANFEPIPESKTRAQGGAYWLKIQPREAPASPPAIPVIVVHVSRQTRVEVFAGGVAAPLVTALAAFGGNQDRVYLVPAGIRAGEPLYARIESSGTGGAGSRVATVSAATLGEALASGAERARMITLAVGALLSVAAASLLIWFVMAETLFILYATLFFLQALYIGFLSGQAFDWPWLWYARPLTSFAWNVPVGLSGAVACLFTREIADLKDFSPRAYKYFGRFAVLFVALTAANLAKLWGFASLVSAIGNISFSVAAVFTLVVAFRSWRRGNRAAGWFLIAWALLEGFTIAAALHFLGTASDQGEGEGLLYYGLPLSMVAAAVLVALGVADRLRQQRVALSDAERRARTDPLTGVLNRRSLIERLDAGCLRARARGLPISLLFIDLDHFKLINDSFGHQAGDACLRAIIDPIHAELRQSDVIGRYGGEEFVVILSSADATAAHPIAQRILERVAKVRVEGFGKPIELTCSIGVAASDTLGVWGEQLLSRADAAVYAAKRSGRNRVHMALPSAA